MNRTVSPLSAMPSAYTATSLARVRLTGTGTAMCSMHACSTSTVETAASGKQKALLVVSKGVYQVSDALDIPEVGDHEVLIKTCAVGLNPIDYKSVDYNLCMPQFPWINGREMAGVVCSVGAGVTTCRPGDRVWTSTI